jgi:hypothetical protein
MSTSTLSSTLLGMATSTRRYDVEQHEKVRENRLRRMAERQGLRLVKSRRRDPLAIDFGTYSIVGTGGVDGLDIEQVETWLTKAPGEDRWRYTEHLRALKREAARAAKHDAAIKGERA